MNEPKYQVGQKVDALWSHTVGYLPGRVESVTATYRYGVVFPIRGHFVSSLTEDQIRLPRPSPEEAWEKAVMLIGLRASEKRGRLLVLEGIVAWNTETRHQCYQILGSAGIKITDEVKRDVRRLTTIADSL